MILFDIIKELLSMIQTIAIIYSIFTFTSIAKNYYNHKINSNK